MPEPTEKKVRGVFERPLDSGIWWIQYFENGRRHRERVGAKSHAIKLYQKRKTQIFTGAKLPELQRRRVTFAELLDCGVAYAQDHNKTARQYVQKADMLRPTFGHRAVEDVKAEELVAWIRARGVTASSFNRYRSFLSLCYREAIRAGKVTVNVARTIPQKREPKGRERFLSRDEYDQVLAIIRRRCPHRVSDFILSVHTGMRLSEQYGLPWKDVDMTRRHLRIRDTKNGESRSIPANSVVMAELDRLRPKRAVGPIFPRPRDGKGSIKPRWFETVISEAGIEDYTWHNNRHTFCSWLAIAGVPLRTIQVLAGHKTISMTARYSHLSPDHKGSEMEKLVQSATPRVVQFPTATKTATS